MEDVKEGQPLIRQTSNAGCQEKELLVQEKTNLQFGGVTPNFKKMI